jgi:hypothetical protein
MTQVFLFIKMIFSSRIPHIPDPHLCGYSLQFTIIIDLTGQAIQWMIRENQLDNIPSQPIDAGAVGIDIGIGNDRRMTRSLYFRRPVVGQGNFYTANPA